MSGTNSNGARALPRAGGPMRRPGGGPGFGHGPMGVPGDKADDPGAALRRLAGRLRPERNVIVAVITLAVGSVLLSVLGPRLLGRATNIIVSGVVGRSMPEHLTKAQVVAGLRASGDNRKADLVSGMDLVPGHGVDMHGLRNVILLTLALYVVSSLAGWAQGWLMAGVTQRVVSRLRSDVDEKLGRLPLSTFDAQARGDLLSRVTNDVENINTSLQQSLTQMITSLLTVVGVLAMMIWTSWLLALISLVVIPASMVLTGRIIKRSQPQFAAQWRWTGALNGHVEETYSGHDVVALFGRQDAARAQFDDANDRVYQAGFKAQFVSGIIQPAMNVVGNLNYVAVAVVGGLQVAHGSLSLGSVQAFIQYSRSYTMPLTQLSSLANLIQSAAASAERVFQVLDEAEESPDPVPAAVVAEPVQGLVEFDHVAFSYSPERPLITDLSLRVEPGQTVAIVGPTGAGKTTLVNLLMRFYDVQGGAIRLDGVDVREMTRDDLRGEFGMVLQDAWLFKGTIEENIAFGREGAGAEDVRAAAQAAHVDHVVRTLPDGYATVLDDAASNISAGERQLLTIARAFLADPAILILDEATSSVDTRTEVLIQRAMARLRRGRTSFVIAHRLSTIRDADLILVMDGGAVVEQGTHAELLAAGGLYARMSAGQADAVGAS